MSRLVLHASDVPRGFIRIRVGFASIRESAEAEHLPSSALVKHGYIASYVGNFIQPGYTTGIHTVDSEVTGYRSAAGARWEYSDFVRANRQELATIKHVRVRHLPLPGLGDQHFGLVAKETLGKLGTGTLDIVAFQRETYWGAILAFSQGQISVQQFRLDARIIDRRIAGAQPVACPRKS